jgi:hypothetical protein
VEGAFKRTVVAAALGAGTAMGQSVGRAQSGPAGGSCTVRETGTGAHRSHADATSSRPIGGGTSRDTSLWNANARCHAPPPLSVYLCVSVYVRRACVCVCVCVCACV